MSKTKTATALLMLLTSLMLCAAIATTIVKAEGTARIWTDKADYAPEEIVTIYGEGFHGKVALTVVRPDGSINDPEHGIVGEWTVEADENGKFETTYQLDGILGTYTVTATDEYGNAATTTFTDANKVAFATSGLPSGVSITISLTIDGRSDTVTFVSPGPSHEVGTGTNKTVTYSGFPTQVTVDGVTYVLVRTNQTSPFNTGSGQGTITVEAEYAVSYAVTFYATASPGLPEDVADDTEVLTVTIGSGSPVSVTKAELPKTFTGIASGTTIAYSYNSPLASTTAGKRYRWDSTSGTGSASGQTGQTGSFSLTSTSTVSATYKAQYRLTVASSHDLPNPSVGEHWYDTGTSVTALVTSPADESGGTRYRCTGWTGTGSVPATGTDTTVTFTITAPSTLTWTWIAQYYLTMSTNYGTVSPGSGWHDAGLVVGISATAPSTVDGERYVWLGWTGTGTISYTGMDNSASITMNSPITQTAAWRHEYRLTMATNFGTTSPSVGEHWYEAGSSVSIQAFAPSLVYPPGQERYVWNGWTGIGPGSYSTLENPASITMNGPITQTASWTHQYLVTFDRTGSGVAPTVTYSIDDGTPSSGTVPFSVWVDSGSSISYGYKDIVYDGADTRYVLTSVSPASPQMVTGPLSITGTYKTQYQVKFAQTGLDDTATGTVVTIDGVITKTKAELPFTYWFDSGTTYSCSSFVSSTVTDKRFRLVDVTGPASPITSPGIVKGNYVPQYRVTFTHLGLDAYATGTVVAVAGVPKTYTELPFITDWLDHGSRLAFEYSDPIGSSVSGKRFVLVSVSPTSPLTITEPTTVTGNYKTQYQVTVTANPDGALRGTFKVTYTQCGTTYTDQSKTTSWTEWVDADTTVTVSDPQEYVPNEAGVDGVRYKFDSYSPSASITMDDAKTITLSYKTQYYLTVNTNPAEVLTLSSSAVSGQGWYDSGATATVDAAQFVDKVSGSSRYDFRSWTGATPTGAGNTAKVVMDGAKTATANYQLQYLVTFDQFGLGSDASGTVVTVFGSDAKTFDQLPNCTWVDSGSTVSFAYEATVGSSVSGKRYVLTRVSGNDTATSVAVNGVVRVTGSYKTQYYLTVVSNYDTPGGGGWYDKGDTAYATLEDGIVNVGGITYGFTSWNGDASGIWLTSNPITMDGPKKAVAVWEASNDLAAYGDVRTVGFWRHQFTVWYRSTLRIKGAGTAQVSTSELLAYLRFIRANSAYFSQIPDPDTHPYDALMYAYTLLAPLKAHTMQEAAEQQLFAVWLNLARKAFFTYQGLSQETEYVYKTYGLSTIAEAINYAEEYLNTQAKVVKDICDSINNGLGIIW
jgi:hypothetical protein